MSSVAGSGFRHEAAFYSGEDGFLEETVPFIRGAVAADEPILVVVSARKISALQSELADDARQVQFADMSELGRNPARIIPAWKKFVDEHTDGGRRLRGIGEPISATRSASELVECHRHESLLNLAFADASDFWLVCPYDTESLATEVLEEARRTHPVVSDSGGSRASRSYLRPERAVGPFDGGLPPPASTPLERSFDATRLSDVRAFVSEKANQAGLGAERTADLVLAASEVVTNSVLHAGGHGTVRVWAEADTVFCEVEDGGPPLERSLIGRERPDHDQIYGRGMWVVNHLCDLVQIRSLGKRNLVRMHMRVP